MHHCRTPLLHGKESVTVFLYSLMQEVALAYNTDSNLLLTLVVPTAMYGLHYRMPS